MGCLEGTITLINIKDKKLVSGGIELMHTPLTATLTVEHTPLSGSIAKVEGLKARLTLVDAGQVKATVTHVKTQPLRCYIGMVCSAVSENTRFAYRFPFRLM